MGSDRHPPFTGEAVILRGGTRASFLADGEPVGVIDLVDGRLFTANVPEPVCAEIAAQLEAAPDELDWPGKDGRGTAGTAATDGKVRWVKTDRFVMPVLPPSLGVDPSVILPLTRSPC